MGNSDSELIEGECKYSSHSYNDSVNSPIFDLEANHRSILSGTWDSALGIDLLLRQIGDCAGDHIGRHLRSLLSPQAIEF